MATISAESVPTAKAGTKEPVKKISEELAEPATWREILPNFLGAVIILQGLYFEHYHDNFFMVVWIPYVLLPLLDFLLPVDHSNVTPERVRLLEKDRRFLIPLYTVWLLDIYSLFWLLNGVSKGTMGASSGNFLLYAFCGAQIGALNAVVGHELIHRKHLIHKITGTLAYSKMLYSHFFIAHIRTHHKKVATPEDPNTALFGESLYQYWARAIPSGYVDVWNYEVNRLAQEGKTSIFHKLFLNRIVTFNLGHAAWLVIVYFVFGGRALCFHLLYSMFITLMFEAVNYLEHYGLLRKKLDNTPNSAYESVKHIHSWNAPQVMTNYLLFKLQRHSDHHANAYKPYQTLDSFVESPMLPYGYSVSLILSIIPYVWKRVIDPSVIATMKGEKVTEEVRQDQEKTVLFTLCGSSLLITYLNFFVMGFN